MGSDPFRLVVFPPNGIYRDEMFEAVEALGRRWRVGYSSTSLAGIQSAVADGLGISLLPARSVAQGHRIVGRESGFPPIETMEIAIHHRPGAGPLLLDLAASLAALVQEPGPARLPLTCRAQLVPFGSVRDPPPAAPQGLGLIERPSAFALATELANWRVRPSSWSAAVVAGISQYHRNAAFRSTCLKMRTDVSELNAQIAR